MNEGTRSERKWNEMERNGTGCDGRDGIWNMEYGRLWQNGTERNGMK